MQLLTTEILFLMVFTAGDVRADLKPDGENVCLQTLTYEETVEAEVQKPVKEVKKYLCFKLFSFRCHKTVTKMKTVIESRVIQRTKILPKCCHGYEEQKTGCFPVCSKRCGNKKCVAPEICACAPGLHGTACEKECPENFWGANCVNKCNCTDNGKCDKISGGCLCESGWKGKRCELPCEDGHYGYSCEMKCNCDNSVCDRKTGECITTTTARTIGDTQLSIQNESVPMNSAATISTDIETERKTVTGESASITETTEESTIICTTEAKSNAITRRGSFRNFIEEKIVSEVMTSNTSIILADGTATKFTGEENETGHDIKLINSEVTDLLSNLETTAGSTNEIKNKEEKMSSLPEMFSEANNAEDDANRISFTHGQQNVDVNKTNNFMSEIKEISDRQSRFTIFIPSFSVISTASFLIVIIAAKWLISKYRKKDRKLEVRTRKKEKQEEQIEFQAENFFWVNNCSKNPVALSDAGLNYTTPILETFKPLVTNNSFISKEK